jgi:ubiquinone/menaquinone biosynthesis C-methylase UbiE
MKNNNEKPVYGNWVSSNMIKMLFILLLIFVCLCAASFSPLIGGWPEAAKWIVRLFLLGIALIFAFLSLYFCACRSLFSYDGKHKLQSKILDFVVSHFEFNNGKILDIGCGNGALSIKLAKRFKNCQVTGMDYWGSMWNFAKEQCEKNAWLEGVADRTAFRKGDAARLDFPDGYFDGAVSNFVFHEVKNQADKRLLVKEALRTVKKGGTFAFHDLFLEKQFYGNIEEFIEELRKEGLQQIEFINTAEELYIPKLLKNRVILGSIGLMYGIK